MTDTATGGLPNLDEILDTAKSRLAETRLSLPINFRFFWHEIPFTARIDEFAGNRRLRLICDLGPVPYTAEDHSLRQVVMGLIGTGSLGDGARYVLGGEHRFSLIGDAPAPDDLNGMAIIAAVTAFLLKLRPYIDLARDAPTLA